MALPSIKFKNILVKMERDDRARILQPLMDWLRQQITYDPQANHCYSTIQEAYLVNTWATDKEFKSHYLWNSMPNHNNCVSFQEIVKSKLLVPKVNIQVAIRDIHIAPRRAIPKKIRGEAWKIQFGTSTKGFCFCCKTELDAFGNWHAGHVISHSSGGLDTSDNLRPVCGSCNQSMGTENMDTFKGRCYP